MTIKKMNVNHINCEDEPSDINHDEEQSDINRNDEYESSDDQQSNGFIS